MQNKSLIFTLIYLSLTCLSVRCDIDTRVFNFTYLNSLEYTIEDMNDNTTKISFTFRAIGYDVTAWSAHDGSEGFFFALGLGNTNFNDTDVVMCRYMDRGNPLFDNFECFDTWCPSYFSGV